MGANVMDANELIALMLEVQPLVDSLSKDLSQVIPDGCADQLKLVDIVKSLIGTLAVKGISLPGKAQACVMGAALFGYILGYRKGKRIPFFYFAPENEEDLGGPEETGT